MLASRCARHAFKSSPYLASSIGISTFYNSELLNVPKAACRAFTTTPRHRREDPQDRVIQQTAGQKSELVEGIKPETVQKDAPAKPIELTVKDPLLAEQTVSNKEQRKADWAIIKEMSKYLWPKDNFGTRLRVGTAVTLLIGAKVLLSSSRASCHVYLVCEQVLNVQIPFYFKSIVDSMNIDFVAAGGTATTVAGAMIIACMDLCDM